MDVILDRVPALDTHTSSQFVLTVGVLDISDGEGHHHAIRVPCRLLVDRVDEIECVFGETPLIDLRVYPDREEFGSQVSALRLVEADMAVVIWIRRTDIEIFIEKALWRIGVRVDDEGRIVDGAGFGAHNYVGGGLSEQHRYGRAEDYHNRRES